MTDFSLSAKKHIAFPHLGKFRTRQIVFALALIFLIWVLIAFLYTPLFSVLRAALLNPDHETVQTLERLMGSRNVKAALWNTFWMTCATIVCVNIIGLFQVAVLEFFEVPGSNILRVAYAIPLVFGSVTAVMGYNFVFGGSGAITALLLRLFPDMNPHWFGGWPAVLMAHSLLMTSYHYLFLRAAIRRVDYATVEAARSLGANPFQALTKIVFPVIRPQIFAVSLLVLLTAMTSLAAPSIWGGRDFRMINQMILGLNSIRRQDMAAMLALMLGSVTLIVFLCLRWIESRQKYVGGSKTPIPLQRIRLRNPLVRLLVNGLAWAFFVLYVTPVAMTILFSFSNAQSITSDILPTHLGLDNYITVLSRPETLEPLMNSVIMSVLAVLVTLCISVFASNLVARSRSMVTAALEFSIFIPWVLPSSLVAIGLILAFDAPSAVIFDKVLVGSWSILPLAYCILVMPMMVRLISASMRGMDPALQNAAQSLGAGPLSRFTRITLPILLPVLVLVGAMGFNDLLSEYTASSFLYNNNNRPLGVAIASMATSSDPEQTAYGLVYSTLVMSVSFVIIVIADRLGLGRAPISAA